MKFIAAAKTNQVMRGALRIYRFIIHDIERFASAKKKYFGSSPARLFLNFFWNTKVFIFGQKTEIASRQSPSMNIDFSSLQHSERFVVAGDTHSVPKKSLFHSSFCLF